ncbi:MAG: ExbD/TolR family protein [Phycisphaerae bacterium]
MKVKRSRTSAEAEVPMSPLIDAVFLLLIFFLVATMIKKQVRDVNLTPPESESAQKVIARDDNVVIGIDAQGSYFYEGRPASLNDLFARLRELAETDPTRQIRLDADADAPFENVAALLDMCTFRGIEDVVIRTYDERYNRR